MYFVEVPRLYPSNGCYIYAEREFIHGQEAKWSFAMVLVIRSWRGQARAKEHQGEKCLDSTMGIGLCLCSGFRIYTNLFTLINLFPKQLSAIGFLMVGTLRNHFSEWPRRATVKMTVF